MSISSEKLDDIRNQSLVEIAIDVHFYWEYKHCKKYVYHKWLYVHSRNEFIRKLKINYPSITADEIFNFIRIYLCYHSTENSDYFFPKKQLWIFNFSFTGLYLKKEVDPEYF